MADRERIGVTPAASLELELLRLLARQGRRVPVPIFVLSLVVAAMARPKAPAMLVAGWLLAVAIVLVVRWSVLGRLPQMRNVPETRRIRIAILLGGLSGVVHGCSLFFFPYLTDFERAIQSMLIVSLCAGSVATTAGYMPIFLAFIVPTLGPLACLWTQSAIESSPGWIEALTAVLTVMLAFLLTAIARDAHRLFSESFAIRTQQAELNRNLSEALAQAEAANRSKTRFLASASHDLRQPMHTLSLFGAALNMRPLDAKTRDIAQHLNLALQALASQLDALLDVSKLDAGIVQPKPQAVALAPLLERLVSEIRPAAERKALELSWESVDVTISTDPLLFERIVRNLLDNAIKYTHAGSVCLAATRASTGDGVVVAVSDSGRGIPVEEQQRVFEEFYQLDNPERDRERGLGLGLAICKRIAELLSIDIRLHSQVGIGTRFELLLPLSTTAPVPLKAATAAIVPPNLCVLVLDDEAAVRLGMRTLLEAMGCRVALAGSTEEALVAAVDHRPNLVLADLRLRGSDNGIDAIHRLRVRDPNLPALLITGDTAPEQLREVQRSGLAMLHKPVSLASLTAAMRGVLSRETSPTT